MSTSKQSSCPSRENSARPRAVTRPQADASRTGWRSSPAGGSRGTASSLVRTFKFADERAPLAFAGSSWRWRRRGATNRLVTIQSGPLECKLTTQAAGRQSPAGTWRMARRISTLVDRERAEEEVRAENPWTGFSRPRKPQRAGGASRAPAHRQPTV